MKNAKAVKKKKTFDFVVASSRISNIMASWMGTLLRRIRSQTLACGGLNVEFLRFSDVGLVRHNKPFSAFFR